MSQTRFITAKDCCKSGTFCFVTHAPIRSLDLMSCISGSNPGDCTVAPPFLPFLVHISASASDRRRPHNGAAPRCDVTLQKSVPRMAARWKEASERGGGGGIGYIATEESVNFFVITNVVPFCRTVTKPQAHLKFQPNKERRGAKMRPQFRSMLHCGCRCHTAPPRP